MKAGKSWLMMLALGACVVLETDAKATELAIGEEVKVQFVSNDQPKVLCYPGPPFNVWRSWEEVTIEVVGERAPMPKVYGASEDDVHGFVDSFIKSKLMSEEERPVDLVEKIEQRAITRKEFIPSLFDLLTECPPIWQPDATSCTKVFSPFGRSCVAVAVPKGLRPGEKSYVTVKATVEFQQHLPIFMFMGIALLILSHDLSKSIVLWYLSGITISVTLGVLILAIFLCRKLGVPGARSSSFALLSTVGFAIAWVTHLGDAIKAFAITNWELLAAYIAIFVLLGVVCISWVRRSASTAHDYCVFIRWTIRAVGVAAVFGGTKSSMLALALMTAATVVYLLSRLSRIGHYDDSAQNKKNE